MKFLGQLSVSGHAPSQRIPRTSAPGIHSPELLRIYGGFPCGEAAINAQKFREVEGAEDRKGGGQKGRRLDLDDDDGGYRPRCSEPSVAVEHSTSICGPSSASTSRGEKTFMGRLWDR